MTKRHSLFMVFMLALSGCASEPVPPPAVEPEPAPVEVTPYEAPPDQPPPPDTPAKPEQTATGRYRLAVASVRTAEQAAEWARRIESKGYRVETESAEVDGVTWQRLVLPGYRSKSDVLAAIGFAEQDLGVSDAWRLPNSASADPASAPQSSSEPAPPSSEPAPAN